MVSNARDDLPEPLRPVITTRRSRGMSTERFFRLCWRAPRTAITLLTEALSRQFLSRQRPACSPNRNSAGGGELPAERSYLESKDLAQFGWAGIGENHAINIDSWDGTITLIPLLDAQRSILVCFDVNLSEGDVILVQEPLGNAAVSAP